MTEMFCLYELKTENMYGPKQGTHLKCCCVVKIILLPFLLLHYSIFFLIIYFKKYGIINGLLPYPSSSCYLHLSFNNFTYCIANTDCEN